MASSPFRFHSPTWERWFFSRWLFRFVVYPLEKLLGFRKIDTRYKEIENNEEEIDFFSKVVSAFEIDVQFDRESLERIPRDGPVVVVSNHPFGAAEAVATASVLLSLRSDLKVLGNFLLNLMPGIRPYTIPVDPFERDAAISANIGPLRHSISWLKKGGLLLTYPAGTVSHLHLRKLEVTDPPWNSSIARIIRKSNATVVPVFIPGRNSFFFQALGLIHPLLRTIQIPREGTRFIGKTLDVKIGRPITPDKFANIGNDEELISYLRMRCYLLGNRNSEENKTTPRISISPNQEQDFETIIDPVEKTVLCSEIALLDVNQKLYENEEFSIYCAKAKFIPNILREIGRLREDTFREVGEGTGKSIDLDRFDEYYSHLFMWSKLNFEVVGAYRIGKIDRIVRAYGLRGLYTHTLFRYRPGTMRKIGPALEMGRSFIRKEYQKNYSSLLLLWKGIGRYVVQNPRYKVLLGPVSISSRYNTVSRHLITLFLKANNFNDELKKYIKPRNPLQSSKLIGIDPKVKSFPVEDLDDISDLLKEVECTEHSLPVLLKQYLRMGGKLMGFNVDPAFGDCLDGLIYVDLTKSDPKLLERYLGKEGAVSFLEYHKLSPVAKVN